ENRALGRPSIEMDLRAEKGNIAIESPRQLACRRRMFFLRELLLEGIEGFAQLLVAVFLGLKLFGREPNLAPRGRRGPIFTRSVCLVRRRFFAGRRLKKAGLPRFVGRFGQRLLTGARARSQNGQEQKSREPTGHA